MADDIAIKVEHVSKTFKLPHEKTSSVKGALINFKKGKKGYEKQHVLDDISFEIKKGEFFGIVGRNGGGKSTLLKLLAGIYTPDAGSITVKGNLTPFIELGVGFNPELSGRENVFLNGALLGFNRSEMAAMYDDIVEFAELERFMDQKLKNYSSGMQVRLAFSIAIKVESEILLFDEVLAVGDERFQKKCLEVFRQLKKQKKTIILVTHDMANVERFCDRALVIDKNHHSSVTTPKEASKIYSRLNINEKDFEKMDGKNQTSGNRSGTGEIKVKEITILANNKKTRIIKTGDAFEVKIVLDRMPSYANELVGCGLAFINEDDVVVAGPNNDVSQIKGRENELVYLIPSIPFSAGDYTVTCAIYNKETRDYYDLLDKWVSFTVVSDQARHGIIELEGKWKAQ